VCVPEDSTHSRVCVPEDSTHKGVCVPEDSTHKGVCVPETVLTKIFVSEREDIRSKYDVALLDTYLSQNIISVIKSRRMRWAGHVARM
jgi:hypothetical protein